jgi:hypothetical protein
LIHLFFAAWQFHLFGHCCLIFGLLSIPSNRLWLVLLSPWFFLFEINSCSFRLTWISLLWLLGFLSLIIGCSCWLISLQFHHLGFY